MISQGGPDSEVEDERGRYEWIAHEDDDESQGTYGNFRNTPSFPIHELMQVSFRKKLI